MAEPVIERLEDLSSIVEEWSELCRAGGDASIFATPAFAEHWYRCFASPDAVRVFRIQDGGETIGFLPMVVDGGVLASLTNLHCMHSTPAMKRGAEARFPSAVARALASSNGWGVARHEYAYGFLPVPSIIDVGAAEAAGLRARVGCDETYAIALPDTFEQYLMDVLSAKAKKNYKHTRNKLDKSGPNSLLVFRDADAVVEWPALVAIENAGWKGDAKSSLRHVDEAYQRYYSGLLELAARRGELRLYFLELNGARIAGALGYIEGENFHWFKTGYNEAFSEFSPSNLLMVRIIEDLIANDTRVKRFHMFPVDFGYKHRFATHRYPTVTTLLFNRTVAGRIAYAKVVARERLKNVAWIRKAARALQP
jgi:CelD/BcsL family acetyltransferase involved in cellulose biosynthesis